MGNKKLRDSIEHFDRFNTDKYVEVMNAKNGIYDEQEDIDSRMNDGCSKMIMVFLFLLTAFSLLLILIRL